MIKDSTLEERLKAAEDIGRIYLNLANQQYPIDDLLSKTLIKRYSELRLKSIYLRTGKLVLDDQFGQQMHDLTLIGLREVIIFCDKEQSQLDSGLFNGFLSRHKIRINFKVVLLSQDDLEKIAQDSVGKNDILGIDGISNSGIVYRNGHTVPLLNNEESDRVIVANFHEHIYKISAEHALVVEEPHYIAQETPDAEKRDKTPDASKARLEISVNIELSTEVTKSVEIDKDIDIDAKQEENKFSLEEAVTEVERLGPISFNERYIVEDKGLYSGHIIYKIFQSGDIQYITREALKLIVQNTYLFEYGINTGNMPIGLALTRKIIFASEERLTSPNEFTLNLKPNSIIYHPLHYSWLKFASHASISFHDVYKTPIAPEITGHLVHPGIGGSKYLNLDAPYNFYRGRIYFQNEDLWYLSAVHNGTGFERKKLQTVESEEAGRLFDPLQFDELLQDDLDQLKTIHAELTKRGILGTLQCSSGNWLLIAETRIFLEKLFKEILPESNTKKITTFKKILTGIRINWDDDLKITFEGLDGCYKAFQSIIASEDTLTEEDVTVLEQQFIEVMQNQATSNFKILGERFIYILQLLLDRGGNINEQMEYFLGSSILSNPDLYLKVKESGVSVVHPFSEWNINLDDPYNKPLSMWELVTQITEISYGSSEINIMFLVLNVLRYEATIPAHQRPSIDVKFLQKCESMYMQGTTYRQIAFSNTHLEPCHKTAEYKAFESMPYTYSISDPAEPLKYYVSFGNVSSADVSKNHIILFIVNGEMSVTLKCRDAKIDIALQEEHFESGKKTHVQQSFEPQEGNKIRELTEDAMDDIFSFIQDETIQTTYYKVSAASNCSSNRPSKISYDGKTYEIIETSLHTKVSGLPASAVAKMEQWYRGDRSSNEIQLGEVRLKELH